MNNDFKNALKKAYGFQKPSKKEDFFKTLTIIEKRKKPVPFFINLMKYSAVPVTAAIAVIIFTSFIHDQNAKNEFVSEEVMTSVVQNDDNFISEDVVNSTEEEPVFSGTAVSDDISAASQTATACSETKEDSENDNIPAFNASVSKGTTAPAASDNNQLSTENSVTTVTTAVSVTEITTHTNQTVTTITMPTTANATRTTPRTTEPPEIDTSPIVTTTHTIPAPIVTTTTDHFEDEPPCDPDYDIKDLRVKPPVIYSKTENIIDVTSAFEDNATDSYSWQLSATMADAAVYGVIDQIFFTSIDGMPYIQADIFIINSLMNYDFGYGDMISIYIPGGYMSMNDFLIGNSWYESEFGDISAENILSSTALFNNGNAELIKTGKSYLFLLQMGYGNMPSGAFTLCNEMDIFTETGSRYYCARNSGISFLKNELTKYFN